MAFEQVPDPRRRQGTRYGLAAILSNHLSILAIIQWAHAPDASRPTALGLLTGKAPHQSTPQPLFAKIDPDGLIGVLWQALAPVVTPPASRGEGARG